ncbi:MAG TPA: Clp protease N-terminal domain-containing protein, partial [Polyangiaceae bacterium]
MVPGRSVRGVPELPALKRLAEQLASERSESPTTVHLLAAVALSPGAAADLLTERKLCAEALLAAAGPGLQDIEQGVQRSLLRARELAGRMGTQQATAAHLLSALLSEPRCAAARALKHCGTDVGRLRAAALNLGLGLIGRRRVPAQPNRGKDAERAAGIELNGAQRPALKVVNAPARTASVVPLRPQQKAPAPEPAPFRAPAPVLDTDRFGLDPHQYPTLASLGHNLTLAAFRGELDPTFGRDAEIEQTLDVLAKRQGNNPCLVGPAGVGKTSVVRGLAKYIAESGSAAGTFNACDERIIVEI